jgi:hypothetical protein
LTRPGDVRPGWAAVNSSTQESLFKKARSAFMSEGALDLTQRKIVLNLQKSVCRLDRGLKIL